MDFNINGILEEGVDLDEFGFEGSFRENNPWYRFHRIGDHAVYGEWYMYTPKVKEDPKTVEEELSIVLEKMKSQIVYAASKSTHLKEEDYASYVAEWVMDRISKFGVETKEEINGFFMQLLQDINRYRAHNGYAISIKDQFFSDFNKVYNYIENNPHISRKDVENFVYDMDMKYKTKNRDRDREYLLSFVDANIFNSKARLVMQNRSLSEISEIDYENCFAMIKELTNGEYKDSSIKGFIDKFINREDEFYLSSTDYGIKYTILSNKNIVPYFKDMYGKDYNMEEIPSKIEAAQFFLNITENNLAYKIDSDEIAKNAFVLQIKTTSSEIDLFKGDYKKSYLYRKACNAGNKVFKKYNKTNPFPHLSKEETSYSYVGQKNTNRYGMEQKIVAYRGTNDIDVLIKDKETDKYYLVSGCKYEQFKRRGNLLLHSKYIELDPTIASMISKASPNKEGNNQVRDDMDIEEDLDR